MKLRIAILFIGALIVIFVLGALALFEFQKGYFEDYVETTFQNSYRGKIIDIKKSRGGIYVELNDGEKYSIVDTYNDLYSPGSLNSRIQLGDSLIKPLNTDSIFLSRSSESYFFILRLEK